jgi:hypothetical protein
MIEQLKRVRDNHDAAKAAPMLLLKADSSGSDS